MKYSDLNIRRVIATASLFAVGMAGLKGQNVTGLSRQEAGKWWTLSGSLRGFYDDNSLNSPQGNEFPGQIDEEGSFGVEFSPGFSINLPLERTLFRASYRLTLNYYEARTENNIDQDHEFKVQLNHKFSQRRELDFDNTFVYSDAPEVRAQEGSFTPRQDSTSWRNNAAIDFNQRLTPILGLTVGYKNNIRDYKEKGDGSLSALLDQVENLFNVDGNWYPNPQTTIFVGYQFGMITHTSDDLLGNPLMFLPNTDLSPERKDSRSHYVYVGGKRQFSPRLDVAMKVGGEYIEYFNDGSSDFSPYIDFTGNYRYLPGSSANLAVTVQRRATDAGVDPLTGEVTQDSLMVQTRVGVNHRITSRIMGAASIQYQSFTYNGGLYDGRADNYFVLDLNLEYKIRENFFVNTGYVWYRLLSNRPDLSFVRNRVYAGVRAVF